MSISIDSFKSVTLKNISDFAAARKRDNANADNKMLDHSTRLFSDDNIVSFLIAADVSHVDTLARNAYAKMNDILDFIFKRSNKFNDVNKTIFINAVTKNDVMNEFLTLDEIKDVLSEKKKNEKRDYLTFKRDAVAFSTLAAQYRPTLDAFIALNMIAEHTVKDHKCLCYKLNFESALTLALLERLQIELTVKETDESDTDATVNRDAE